MHDLNDPSSILDREIVESKELLGKECVTCGKILAYAFFRRDSSYRDGRRDRCQSCENAPRLSTAEHTARLKELNYSSHAVQKQRWENQEDYENTVARLGTPMHHSDLLYKIRRLVPNLYITEGRIIGDLAVFQTYPCPQPDLEGRDFRYLFYIPTGVLPEFSQYEFDERDVPIRESKRGWRTVLLRLIKMGLLSEEACDREFGRAQGIASTVWYRQLYQFRNRK
jgi:hypothetical protein